MLSRECYNLSNVNNTQRLTYSRIHIVSDGDHSAVSKLRLKHFLHSSCYFLVKKGRRCDCDKLVSESWLSRNAGVVGNLTLV